MRVHFQGQFAMEFQHIDKLDTETLKISFRRSKSTEVLDIEQLPFECLKIEKKPIKDEIKKLIEKNGECSGAIQVEKKTLNFK
jgi:hypothetical protein